MTPLPKRRLSSRRQGKREKANLKVKLLNISRCPKCSKPKLPHKACSYCGFYK